MSEPETDDRAPIRAEHDRQRRYVLGVIGFAVLLSLAAMCAIILTLIPPNENPFPIWCLVVLLPVAVSGAALSGWMMFGARENATTDRLRACESYGDRLQRKRDHALLFTACPTLLLLCQSSFAAWKIASGQGNGFHWLMAPLAILIPVMIGLTMSGIGTPNLDRIRRHFDDEMAQSHRKRALALGFWILLGATTAVYFLGLWRASLAVTAMPLALAVGVQAAVLKLILFERHADRDG